MTAWTLAWGGAVIFLAGILRGFTGFGFAQAAVPLASLFLPPQAVVAAVLTMSTAIGLRDCWREMPHADRGAVARLSAGAVLGTPFGVAALALAPLPVIRLALGGVVAAAVLVSWRPPRAAWAGTPRAALVAGLVSGVCNGLAGMSGPAAMTYLLASRTPPVRMRSSLMAYFPIAALSALPVAYASGVLSRSSLLLAAVGLPAMVAGGWIGTAIFRRAGGGSHRTLALWALSASALLSIARGLQGFGL